jgi:hypothetical protein
MPELTLQSSPGFRRAPLDDAGALRDDPTASFIERIRGLLPTEHEIDAMLTRKNRFLRCPSNMTRASVYPEVGGYLQEPYYDSADTEMWLRIARKAR